MTSLFSQIGSLIASLSLIVSGFSHYTPVLGATASAPTPLFDTVLSQPLGTADSTMYLKSVTDNQGNVLSGNQCFTVDTGTSIVEYLCGTISGTTVINLTRNLSYANGTTTKATPTNIHRVGADVRITDFPTLVILANQLTGKESIDTPMIYSFASSTFNYGKQIVDKDYVDNLAFNGAGVISATTQAQGVVQLATGGQAASSTGTGSSGPLVIPASLATSTYNSATASLRVVMTNNSGQIDNGFLSTFVPTLATSTASFTNGDLLQKIGMHKFVATTTQQWPVPTGTLFADVQCVGGGGGGAGGATGSDNADTASGGGGAGAYMRESVNVTGTTSVQVVIGSGGNGGAPGSGGSSGGNTSFGPYLSATGGTGGTWSNVSGSAKAAGGAGGTASSTASTTIMSIPGGDGGPGFAIVPTSGTLSVGGYGGASFFGGGPQGAIVLTGAASGNATSTVWGVGGSGAAGLADTAENGGGGAPGACIITY